MHMSLCIETTHWLTVHNMTILILSLFNGTNAGPRDDKAAWPYSVPKFGADIGDEAETSFSFPNDSRKIKVFLTSDTIKVVLTSDTIHRLFCFCFQGPLSF
jgi:hypothetical protein